ncbi:hypothetical protein C8F04DRAFT_1131728 [Mycena alexandri]|uniref:Uncharacterized protein n=1 Tax=Mycena alexandri TaxID=1745969 RepID=A0AAD6SBC4_9AGAR|nr:hypothetical protein C8F04DRAFT_1131728 [Mycena alexandri]
MSMLYKNAVVSCWCGQRRAPCLSCPARQACASPMGLARQRTINVMLLQLSQERWVVVVIIKVVVRVVVGASLAHHREPFPPARGLLRGGSGGGGGRGKLRVHAMCGTRRLVHGRECVGRRRAGREQPVGGRCGDGGCGVFGVGRHYYDPG